MPRSTVRRRLDRLIKEDIIRIVALPNPFSMGYSVWATVLVSVAAGRAQQVADGLLEFPQFYSICICLGRFDILAAGHFKSVEELNQVVTEELPKIEGVTRTETVLVTAARKYYDFVWRGKGGEPERTIRTTSEGSPT